MKNTVSRFCSVAFVQNIKTDQLLHPVQWYYLSVYRLDALPSLADLAHIIPSRLFLQPGQSLFSQTPCREPFFVSLHTTRIKQDIPVTSPLSQRRSDGIILDSSVIHPPWYVLSMDPWLAQSSTDTFFLLLRNTLL